jgi:hypothetical protein
MSFERSYLRVAMIDTTTRQRRNVKKNDSEAKPKICLNLHVVIYKLGSRYPTKQPPKVLHTTSIQLGCWKALPGLHQFPFMFQWQVDQLYVTMSASQLRTYRIVFPELAEKPSSAKLNEEESIHNKFHVLVPKETIFLPRSAINRSVQFIPGKADNLNSVIIIGPKQEHVNPAPPLMVVLQPSDLGPWIPLAEKESEEAKQVAGKLVLKGRLEDFDEDDDCDLIPL